MEKTILVIWGIMFFGILIFAIYIIYSSVTAKGNSRRMRRMLNRSKTVLEDNKDAIKDLQKLGAEMGIDVQKGILEDNEYDLRDIASLQADIDSVGLEKRAAAIKKGLSEDSKYCKHCGALIDMDSRYCKVCGKEQ